MKILLEESIVNEDYASLNKSQVTKSVEYLWALWWNDAFSIPIIFTGSLELRMHERVGLSGCFPYAPSSPLMGKREVVLASIGSYGFFLPK